MKTPSRKLKQRLLAGAVAFALAALAGWWFRARPEPVEASVFFPEELSLAVQLRDAEAQWLRYWRWREPGADPADAMRRILERLGTWERWEREHGASGALLRLQGYQAVLSELLGEEAWLLFGRWEGQAQEDAADESVGLVALIRSDSRLLGNAGRIADMILEEYKIEAFERGGIPYYLYRGVNQRRTLSFCQLQGWLCISMRQDGPGPLPLIIDRFAEAAPPAPRPLWGAHDALLRARFTPLNLIEQLRVFYDQRGKKPDKKLRREFERWERALAGSDRLDLQLNVNDGLRLRLNAQGESWMPQQPGHGETEHEATSVASGEVPSDWLAALSVYDTRWVQVLAWRELFKDKDEDERDFSLLTLWPGFQVLARLQEPAEAMARGVVLIAPPGVLLPHVVAWSDVAPWSAATQPRYWTLLAPESPEWPAPDRARWIPELGTDQRAGLAREHWESMPSKTVSANSSARLSINPLVLQRWMQSIPQLGLGKKQRHQLERWTRYADLAQFVLGPQLRFVLSFDSGQGAQLLAENGSQGADRQ